MKVVAITEVGKVEIVDRDLPKIGPRDVLLKIKAAGLRLISFNIEMTLTRMS